MGIVLKKFENEHREKYLQMSEKFYKSDAVSHEVSNTHFENTFKLAMENSPFVEGYLIYSDGEVEGYGLLSIGYSNEAGGMEIWIEELYIEPSHRGRGAGKVFMEFVEKQYEGIVRIRLEVAKNNKKAIALYEKNGYEFVPYTQMMKYIK